MAPSTPVTDANVDGYYMGYMESMSPHNPSVDGQHIAMPASYAAPDPGKPNVVPTAFEGLGW